VSARQLQALVRAITYLTHQGLTASLKAGAIRVELSVLLLVLGATMDHKAVQGDYCDATTAAVTPQMIEVGVQALRQWLGAEERLLVWDHLAARDLYVAMHALSPCIRSQTIQTPPSGPLSPE